MSHIKTRTRFLKVLFFSTVAASVGCTSYTSETHSSSASSTGSFSTSPTVTPSPTASPSPSPSTTPTPTTIPGPTNGTNPWHGILDSSSGIDWSQVGVPGGVPKRTTVCATILATNFGNGTTDATAAIQSALNGCPKDGVVSLSAGTFRINSSITVPSNITLRGAGPQNTILKVFGSSEGAINLGTPAEPNPAQAIDILSGATSGSKQVVVSNASNVAVGKYLIISQLNPSYVSSSGEGGQNCTWCDWWWGGTRLMQQVVEVTSVSGTTIGITPLYTNFSNAPKAMPFAAGGKYAGVENLQVYANNTGYTTMELMKGCAYCWIKGVENNFTDGDHVRAMFSFRTEIRDSYFSNAFNHSPGSTDADVFVATSSGTLVENNIMERLHTSIMLNWGASGNVIAYNYTTSAFGDGIPFFQTEDIGMHGAHPAFNLIEGNVATNFTADSTWGSSSHNTLFRNWFKGTTKIVSPTSGRITIDWSTNNYAVQQVRAVELCFLQRYFNIIGNVVGSQEMSNLKAYNGTNPLTQVPMTLAPQIRSYDGAAYGFSFGYSGAGDNGSAPEDNPLPFTTSFLHGNYEYIKNATTWSSANSVRSLPASFYLQKKPSWFGSLSWPLSGPDVSGGTSGARGYSFQNPATLCWSNTARNSDGLLQFDPTTCYGN